MPLLDHFRPPLCERRHWDAFHARWASAIADDLNDDGLPDNLFAEPTVGQAQNDVATFDDGAAPSNGREAASTLAAVRISDPSWVIPAVFADSFEVRVLSSEGGPRLVAAIELVSPGNKDRPQTRRAFAAKCASYLYQGIACMVVDVVTSRSANLHNEIMDLMLHSATCRLPPETNLYATSYRPVRHDTREEIDAWQAGCGIGDELPTLPLYLGGNLAIVIQLEASYQETCRRLRMG